MIQNRWLALTLLFVARAVMGLQFQSIGSVGALLTEQFDFELALLGLLIGIYLFAGVFIAVPGGVATDRYGPKNLLVLALALMAIGGALCGAATGLWLLFAGRVVSGAGGVLLNVVVAKMVGDRFPENERSTAMALVIAAWPLGIGIGLFGLGDLAVRAGWPSVMYLVAGLCLANLVLVLLFFEATQSGGAVAGGKLSRLSRAEWWIGIAGGIVWGVYNAGFVVIISYLPLVSIESGKELAEATRQLSWLSWSLLLTVPLGGVLADRWGRPGAVVVAGLLFIALAIGLLAAPGLSTSGYILVLLSAGLPAGAILALPTVHVGSENRATVIGIFYAVYYALMGLLPSAAGLAGDVFDTPKAPLLFTAFLIAVVAVGFAIFSMRLRQRPILA